MGLTEIAFNFSLLLFALVCFGNFLLFADALFLQFELKTFLKALGFAALFVSFLLRFFDHSLINLHVLINAAALYAILFGIAIDYHSKLKFLPILPLAAYFVFGNHGLLFIESALIAIVIFQLVYTTKHKDLIPLGVGFVLISMGEYFYSLETKANLSQLAIAGAFPYLFASLVLLLWLWSYLALRFFHVLKSD